MVLRITKVGRHIVGTQYIVAMSELPVAEGWASRGKEVNISTYSLVLGPFLPT